MDQPSIKLNPSDTNEQPATQTKRGFELIRQKTIDFAVTICLNLDGCSYYGPN